MKNIKKGLKIKVKHNGGKKKNLEKEIDYVDEVNLSE